MLRAATNRQGKQKNCVIYANSMLYNINICFKWLAACSKRHASPANCKVEFTKLIKYTFFLKNICTYQKKAIPLHQILKINNLKTKIMKNERKQLEIITSQLKKALNIVMQQKKRYEKLQSDSYNYNWTCEDENKDNEIAIGILGAIENIECAIENIYN